MDENELVIIGDTSGVSWVVPVKRFKGINEAAPKVYMQGALHADELPGPAVLHFLCGLLRQAEAENRIVGDITIVPQANPVGLAQQLFLQLQGRFDSSTGTNFNRDFPLISLQDRELLLSGEEAKTAIVKLKNRLLNMALAADIVVDLHCDNESLFYAYICEEFWPDAKDFAGALGLHSVFLSDGQSTAFEEAVAYAFRQDESSDGRRRFVTTLELRGQSDVDETLAKADATGLYNFLTGRGIIAGDAPEQSDWSGKATLLDHIEVVRSPVSGTILFNQSLNSTVKAGELLAKIITNPGDENGVYEVVAPQDGTIITRSSNRFVACGDQLYKMTCDAPTTAQRAPGALES